MNGMRATGLHPQLVSKAMDCEASGMSSANSLLSVAMGSCRLEGNPEAARNNAVERITKLYYKVMAFQSKQPSTLTPPATNVSKEIPGASVPPSANFPSRHLSHLFHLWDPDRLL